MKKVLLFLVLLLVLTGIALYLFSPLFERVPPTLSGLEGLECLKKKNTIKVCFLDAESGLKEAEILLKQGKNERVLFKKSFPKGKKREELRMEVVPEERGLREGKAELVVAVRDRSLWHMGRGNLFLFRKEITIDFTPPMLQSLDHTRYVYLDGAGVVLFLTSKDARLFGVKVGNTLFKGYVVKEGEKKTVITFFGAIKESHPQKGVFLYSQDRVGNESLLSLPVRIINRERRVDKVDLTDHFISDRVLPLLGEGAQSFSPIVAFQKVNEELRKKNEALISKIASNSLPRKLWRGHFLKMRRSKVTATFGDMRTYYYKGKKVGNSVHLGYDLASISHASVPAANHGIVSFTGNIGVYGNLVMIDHGLGVTSLYAHLSDIKVKKGEQVRKGEIIGHTDTTGLATGDHLHFGILVGGIPVSPIEWWDIRWIKERIEGVLKPYLSGRDV